MKLKMYFLMLALGVCGAAMQSCDDDDDNLKVPEKLQSAFSQKYPEASPKWKTRGNYYIADFHRNGPALCGFARSRQKRLPEQRI